MVKMVRCVHEPLKYGKNFGSGPRDICLPPPPNTGMDLGMASFPTPDMCMR
jgi:hypothetical protein